KHGLDNTQLDRWFILFDKFSSFLLAYFKVVYKQTFKQIRYTRPLRRSSISFEESKCGVTWGR
ncbi:MAG: hypothetical protein CRN43_10885, partial [Candidatus Nephrothrix sp. EaCA]